MQALIPQSPPSPIQQLAAEAVAGCRSPATRRNYAREIGLYLASGAPLTRSGLHAYLQGLQRAGKGPVSQNVALAAIKRLALEANARGVLDDVTMNSLERVKAARPKGAKYGHWLSQPEAQAVLDQAGTSEHPIRDRAVVACMLGCGLRRTEVVSLTWEQWREVQGRWVWVDLVGKGQRVRTVPCVAWAARYVESWREQSGAQNPHARVFSMSGQNAYLVVRAAGQRAGVGDLAPHDLRRTWARLSYESGADLKQIQHVLGHGSIQTTERYIGLSLELRAGLAAGDKWNLR